MAYREHVEINSAPAGKMEGSDKAPAKKMTVKSVRMERLFGEELGGSGCREGSWDAAQDDA